ncbi:hypothetical protein HBH70_150410 [Parastagonospora nodorum]|nr:hypothetical protein HBH53_045170 [Parastagonospora nodorum]KAH3980389.1 hypothetical protein HBH52_092350 [Parastagonospora nodorum]KAH4001918.1 hypothetical protein HBI10_081880 [Parastagonospora nodorum]KAH4031840.1 hypothetical protein HBI13_016270 [Parastagonospora nodorum]KAH4047215.1 hypothetical protein HBH49_171170 [Parastagonospora nodorum]
MGLLPSILQREGFGLEGSQYALKRILRIPRLWWISGTIEPRVVNVGVHSTCQGAPCHTRLNTPRSLHTALPRSHRQALFLSLPFVLATTPLLLHYLVCI